MLPSELARYKIENNKVIPLFATVNDKELAESIIELFAEGKKVGEILDNIKVLEKIYNTPHKIKLIRGFYKEMIRQCDFLENSPIDPRIIRREIFSLGPVTTDEKRREIISSLNEKFRINVEKFMFADMDEEKVIINIRKIDPITLIKMYNLSLLQTLLFKSYKLTVQIEGNWKDIIRRIKWLGLMYFAYPNPLRIDIIGPTSLLKLSEKYGRNMAVLLPYIVSSNFWKISADIILGNKFKRTYKLEVEKFDLISSFIQEEDQKKFDSTIEERFYQDFTNIIKDWKLLREPETLVVNQRLFIPDFVAIKNPFKVYIEIVGFWTKEYIKEKIEKISNFKDGYILILLNEDLNKEDFSNFNVIKYKNKINVALVYRWLKNLENTNVSKINLDYNITGDVVSIRELTKKLQISEDILRKNLKQFDNYVFLKNYYISKDLLSKLSSQDFNNKQLDELIRTYGDYITEVLEYLGYKFKWINITNAIVIR
ncbi:DUF790 family protein [Acidianus sulfidivorans JP7]|uniref:DUF790 domain-containing protein n=1 Tax=Acidianus sulfidivorans JP7 TaxID=619593 RepID=A0A2U9IKR5_9CREN|nr:DUF790 family protein [Acidianus sulfidivorans]AWR96586.1 DUF790 family protein [Acidianus sulfidivorans JP7]